LKHVQILKQILPPSALNALRKIKRSIFGGYPTPFLAERPDLADFKIGRLSYGFLRVLRWNRNGNLEIGNYCSFAENSTIMLGGEHNPKLITTFALGIILGGVEPDAHEATYGDVTIGNDVWLGTNAMVMSGVTIGDGAVIGANSLVSTNVPPYAIVSGNPARVVWMRFPRDAVEKLLQLRWWDWPDEKVRRLAPILMSSNVDALIAAHESEMEQ
jgi:acetyltransferase-like isoleucine patch superfamily enzyme